MKKVTSILLICAIMFTYPVTTYAATVASDDEVQVIYVEENDPRLDTPGALTNVPNSYSSSRDWNGHLKAINENIKPYGLQFNDSGGLSTTGIDSMGIEFGADTGKGYNIQIYSWRTSRTDGSAARAMNVTLSVFNYMIGSSGTDLWKFWDAYQCDGYKASFSKYNWTDLDTGSGMGILRHNTSNVEVGYEFSDDSITFYFN